MNINSVLSLHTRVAEYVFRRIGSATCCPLAPYICAVMYCILINFLQITGSLALLHFIKSMSCPEIFSVLNLCYSVVILALNIFSPRQLTYSVESHNVCLS